MNLVVLISGRGSNLAALLEAIEAGRCLARVVGVVTDRPSAAGLGHANARGIPTRIVSPRDFSDRPTWDRALADAAESFQPALVLLAGFMRIVSPAFLERFPGRVVNIHPSLLPAFPGVDGPAQALAKGVRISGCTVHLVDVGTDTGPVLAQAAVPVLPDDDVERLHARIQRVEHRLLPAIIDCIARGQLELRSGAPTWKKLAAETDAFLIAPPLEA